MLTKFSYFYNLSKLKTLNLLLLSSLALCFNISCTSPDEPVKIQAHKHSCKFCMMKISDMKFKAQVITQKGKTHFFDSIECLSAWSMENSKKIKSSWVSDYLDNKKWINLKKAKILYSSKLSSPMGAGLSAHANASKLLKVKKLFPGKELNPDELAKHINNWQKKNSVK